MRVSFLRAQGVRVDDNVRVRPGVLVKGGRNVEIGRNSYLGEGTMIVAYGGKVSIGSEVLIAERVYISTRNHRFRDGRKNISDQGYRYGDVFISSNCWLAHGSVVTAGSYLPSGSVVSALTRVSGKFSEPMLHRSGTEHISLKQDND